MNIKELFNKLFKSGTKNYGLALPTDLVSVPMRDRLDDEKIKELEEYKANYFRLLEQKKHFTSRDIEAADFNQEMLMNFELFGRLVINHDNNYNLDTMKDYEKEELWIKQRVTPQKIKLYVGKMEAMFNETHLRLVALKEIYSESGKRLSKDKQNAILNEIYNLTSSYIVFKNNIYAALTEVESYKKELSYNQNAPDVIDQEKVLSKHLLYLSYYAGILIPNKLYELKKTNFDEIEEIAYLERELEIYAYNHLKIDDLNKELNEIDKIEKTPENRQMLLDKINELEIKYLVLNNYGGYELDLKPLYEVKFDILTIDIVRQENSPFKDIPSRELKYYEDIILDKFTTNIAGVDSLLNQRLDDDHKYLIDCFTGLLKYGDNYNFPLISIDTFCLSLILSAASDEQMMYFFNNYQIDFKNPKIFYRFAKELPSVGIKIEDKVPLGTVCWINDIDILMGKNGQGFISEDTNRIVKIYNYFINKENEKETEYRLPDGITSIAGIFRDGYAIRNKILNDAYGKIFKTPDSLKSLALQDSNDTRYLTNVILNEGLESFFGSSLVDGYTTKSITIPSTLQNAYESILNNALHTNDAYAYDYDVYMEKLIFTNYEDSITLHDEKQMDDIIRCLYEASMWYLWSELYSNQVKPPYVKLKFPPHDIVLVSKDGHQVVVSIDTIVNIEFLCMMKSKYAKGFTDIAIRDIYSYFKENYEDKIINEAKEKINKVINNETKTTNKKK